MSVETDSSDKESDDDDDDDDAMRGRFDDIEDERTTVMDDGFELIEVDKPKFNKIELKSM